MTRATQSLMLITIDYYRTVIDVSETVNLSGKGNF